MNKKAQGLPINVIIIAAIALIVLVVLVAVFTGRFGIFSKSLDECPGNCVLECNSPNVIMNQYKCEGGISEKTSLSLRITAGVNVCCMKLEK